MTDKIQNAYASFILSNENRYNTEARKTFECGYKAGQSDKEDIFHAAQERLVDKMQELPPMTEDEQIKLKHALLDSVWGINWKQYDNGYAVAYQNIREVFDAGVLPYIEAYKTSANIKTIIHLLRDSDRPISHAKLMDDAASLLESHKALSIELHDLKCAIREALCQIEGNKCDLSQGAGAHEVLHNAGVQRDMDIIKQCCEGFL